MGEALASSDRRLSLLSLKVADLRLRSNETDRTSLLTTLARSVVGVKEFATSFSDGERALWSAVERLRPGLA